MHSNQCMHQAPDMTSAYQEKLFSFATQCTSRAVMIFTRVTSAAHWWQTSGYEHKATVKHFGGSKWHLFCQQQIEGDMCQGGESHFFLPHPQPRYVSISRPPQQGDLKCWSPLTWIVQVYSESSSSLTVQLHSLSRLLMLLLISRLSIFSIVCVRDQGQGRTAHTYKFDLLSR